MVRIGIAGCGRIARLVHIPAFMRHSGVRIAAIAEPDDTARAAAAAMVPQARVFQDWRDMIGSGEADAIVVTLPPALHAEAGKAALEAGCHLYMEKPIATRLEDGAALAAAHAATSLAGQIGLNFRHNAFFIQARDQVRSGALGPLVAVRTSFCSASRTLPDWKRSRAGGGGVLRDLGVHHLDLIEFVCGEPIVEVQAAERSLLHEADTATVMARTASGVLVEILVSFSAGQSINRVEIFGGSGQLVADTRDAAPRPVETAPSDSRGFRVRAATAELAPRRFLRPGGEASFDRAFAGFVAAIAGGRAATPDLATGLRALRLVLAAEQAAQSKSAVPVAAD